MGTNSVFLDPSSTLSAMSDPSLLVSCLFVSLRRLPSRYCAVTVRFFALTEVLIVISNCESKHIGNYLLRTFILFDLNCELLYFHNSKSSIKKSRCQDFAGHLFAARRFVKHPPMSDRMPIVVAAPSLKRHRKLQGILPSLASKSHEDLYRAYQGGGPVPRSTLQLTLSPQSCLTCTKSRPSRHHRKCIPLRDW